MQIVQLTLSKIWTLVRTCSTCGRSGPQTKVDLFPRAEPCPECNGNNYSEKTFDSADQLWEYAAMASSRTAKRS